MKKILVIKSSLQGANGNSNKATQRYLDERAKVEVLSIYELDLNDYCLPHLTQEEMQAWATDPAQRTQHQVELASHSDTFIQQLRDADEVVLAVPMYNFAIPSTLKAYFDRIARAGITFKYTESGPRGLLTHLTATVIAARGGVYQSTPLDTQTSYIKNFLEFVGVPEINFIYIEGLAMGDDSAKQAWQGFNQKLTELFA